MTPCVKKSARPVGPLPVLYAPVPFARSGRFLELDPALGLTLAEVAARAEVPAWFWEGHGEILIDGEVIPPAWWHRVRPHAGMVTLKCALGGGGGGQGGQKNVATILATVAIIAAATAISYGALGPAGLGLFGPSFAAGGTGATATALAVTIAGTLAIHALALPPVVPPKRIEDQGARNAAAQANVIEPDGVAPRVVGSVKIFPPAATFPFFYLLDDDETVETIFALSGPHKLDDIRVDNVPINSIDGVHYETREGFDNDEPLALIQRYGRFDTPQLELSEPQVNIEDGAKLVSSDHPEKYLPVWHTQTTRLNPDGESPDEIHMHFLFPQGAYNTTNEDKFVEVALRFRMRILGTETWINLPETHIIRLRRASFKILIILKWGFPSALDGADDSLDLSGFSSAFFSNIPDQEVDPTNIGGWTADASFPTGGPNNINVTDMARKYHNQYRIFLDPAVFPLGHRWEISVKRSMTYTDIFTTNYKIGGTLFSLFDYHLFSGDAFLASSQSQTKNVAKVMWLRLGYLWKKPPITRPGFALIAVSGKNVNLQRVSTLASGYVRDYDSGPGTWTKWTTTSNPVPHFRDCAIGEIIDNPFRVEAVDDDQMVAWRALCRDNEWTADLVLSGDDVRNAWSRLAACGRARWYQAEKLSVVVDYDRSAENIKQLFTPVNSNNFRWEKLNARRPDGLILNWTDRLNDFQPGRPLIAFREGVASEDAKLFETVTIDGKVDEAKVQADGDYMMAAREARDINYYLDVDIEGVISRNGDLVGVAHDTLEAHSMSARILGIILNGGGNVEALDLDAAVPVFGGNDIFAEPDLFAVTELYHLGEHTGAAIALENGGALTKELLYTGLTETAQIKFATPFAPPSDLAVDRVVTVGPLGRERVDLILKEITRERDETATLVMVDVANEIHA